MTLRQVACQEVRTLGFDSLFVALVHASGLVLLYPIALQTTMHLALCHSEAEACKGHHEVTESPDLEAAVTITSTVQHCGIAL